MSFLVTEAKSKVKLTPRMLGWNLSELQQTSRISTLQCNGLCSRNDHYSTLAVKGV